MVSPNGNFDLIGVCPSIFQRSWDDINLAKCVRAGYGNDSGGLLLINHKVIRVSCFKIKACDRFGSGKVSYGI